MLRVWFDYQPVEGAVGKSWLVPEPLAARLVPVHWAERSVASGDGRISGAHSNRSSRLGPRGSGTGGTRWWSPAGKIPQSCPAGKMPAAFPCVFPSQSLQVSPQVSSKAGETQGASSAGGLDLRWEDGTEGRAVCLSVSHTGAPLTPVSPKIRWEDGTEGLSVCLSVCLTHRGATQLTSVSPKIRWEDGAEGLSVCLSVCLTYWGVTHSCQSENPVGRWDRGAVCLSVSHTGAPLTHSCQSENPVGRWDRGAVCLSVCLSHTPGRHSLLSVRKSSGKMGQRGCLSVCLSVSHTGASLTPVSPKIRRKDGTEGLSVCLSVCLSVSHTGAPLTHFCQSNAVMGAAGLPCPPQDLGVLPNSRELPLSFLN
nr:uncharacterized protein LOC112423944 [Macaca nemestrina]